MMLWYHGFIFLHEKFCWKTLWKNTIMKKGVYADSQSWKWKVKSDIMVISTSQLCPTLIVSEVALSTLAGWQWIQNIILYSSAVLYYYNSNLFDFHVHYYIVQQELLQSKKELFLNYHSSITEFSNHAY